MPRPPTKQKYESYIKFSNDESAKESGASWQGWAKIFALNEMLLAVISDFKREFKDFSSIQEHLKELTNGIEYTAKELQFNLNSCRHNLNDALKLIEELAQDYRYSLFEAAIDDDRFKEGFLVGNFDVGDNEALLIDIENYILNKFKPVSMLAWQLYHVMIRAA